MRERTCKKHERGNECSLIPVKIKRFFCNKIYGKEDLKRSDYQNGPITEMWNTLKRCSSLKFLAVWGVRLKAEATSLSFAYLLRRNQHYKQYALLPLFQ